MSAIPAAAQEEDEGPRLYSKGFRDRVPIDVVHLHHSDIHALLIRWGAWARARAVRRSLASVEGLYRKTAPSTAPIAAAKEIINLDRAITRMPEQHRTTLIRLYVFGLTPCSICKLLRLRYEGWSAWVFACRAMARNLLRRHST